MQINQSILHWNFASFLSSTFSRCSSKDIKYQQDKLTPNLIKTEISLLGKEYLYKDKKVS